MNGNVLGIFAKEPIPGQVKTRLCPPLTPEQAALLYLTSLKETVAAMSGAPADLVLFYEGDAAFFKATFPHLALFPQASGGLGMRLERALAKLLSSGYQYAALIGSDSPDLPLPLVKKAFDTLRQYDPVIIPAEDGGYILIGEQDHQPLLFHEIPWSTAGVLPATLLAAERLDLQHKLIGGWDDFDDESSLERLIHRSPDSQTALLAQKLLISAPVSQDVRVRGLKENRTQD